MPSLSVLLRFAGLRTQLVATGIDREARKFFHLFQSGKRNACPPGSRIDSHAARPFETLRTASVELPIFLPQKR